MISFVRCRIEICAKYSFWGYCQRITFCTQIFCWNFIQFRGKVPIEITWSAFDKEFIKWLLVDAMRSK